MVWTAGSILEGQMKLVAELTRADGRTLWQARDLEDDREVLVELARASWRPDSAELLGFHDFAEAALSLRHPSLVAVLGHGLDGERLPYVVRETTPGATVMSAVAADGALGLRRVARIVEQLLRVLDLVHEKGLARAGVTPDRVYLTGRGDDVKLWVELVSTRPTRASRDLCCAAPERLLDGAADDARSSLWEVAALAYYALSGRAPFVAPNPTALAESVGAGRFPRIALRGDGGEASRIELDVWFKKALSARLEDRFANARAMLDAWQNVVGGLLLFVDHEDAGAVTLVPAPNDDDRVALRPSSPPPDTEPTTVFAGPLYGSEDVTRVSHGNELASLLDDEEEDDTVISVRAEDLEVDRERSAPEAPPLTERSVPAEPPERELEPVDTKPPSGRPTEFPFARSVRPEQPERRGPSPLMLAAMLAIAALSSATTTWLSGSSAPAAPVEACDCSAAAPAPCSEEPKAAPVEAPRADERPPAAVTTSPPPPSATPQAAPSPPIIWPSPVRSSASVAVTTPGPSAAEDADDPYD